MAKRLDKFPGQTDPQRGKYPWNEWADGSVWEIRRGEDYDVATENMRVNLHLKADALARKVRTHKIADDRGEGLVFQFLESDEMEVVKMAMAEDPVGTKAAMTQLYADAINIYERARREVTIEKSDGTMQKYAPVRYKQQIERAFEEDALVPSIARIIRKPTTGFGHLEKAERPDLMLETLVLDESRPYHKFFSPTTVQVARDRMDDYARRHPSPT
jgi:hypothetical protein